MEVPYKDNSVTLFGSTVNAWVHFLKSSLVWASRADSGGHIQTNLISCNKVCFHTDIRHPPKKLRGCFQKSTTSGSLADCFTSHPLFK